MSTAIPSDLNQFVEREVASGKYRSREEVISEGLRLLRERERKLEALRTDIQVGLDQIAKGDVIAISGDEERLAFVEGIKTRGRERLKEKASQA